MRHGSLFSGIGGFDLAAEWMGWENVFHCEWMPFPRKILNYYWPKSISYENICTTDFSIHRGQIDILTGGFPCQPYSAAGKRLGKEDERHLWPEMLRAIREIEPTWVVGENVRGLTNWNGGMVFEEVCADLEACGYEVQSVLLPAAGIGAPHQRQRIWFVAYSDNSRNSALRSGNDKNRQKESSQWEQSFIKSCRQSDERTVANSDSKSSESEIKSERGISSSKWSEMGQKPSANVKRKHASDSNSGGVQRYRGKSKGEQLQATEFNKNNSKQFAGMDWKKFPTQSPICGGDDGFSFQLDDITFSKWRKESIKGYGNAVVPQLVLQIFKVIEQLKQRQ